MTRGSSRFQLRFHFSLLLSIYLTTVATGCGGATQEDAPSEASSHPAQTLPEETAAALELEATYSEAFSFLNGIREFPDGTVLAADPLTQVLLRIDLDASTADTLGRVGPGPQEYEQPDQVFPLPGDSSLLVDLGKAQLTIINPDGTFGEGLPMMVPQEGGFPDLLHPRFVDGEGSLYDRAGRSRDGGPPDSAAVTRFHRGSRTLDTVAMVWVPENNLVRTQRHGFLPRLLEAMDDWAVGPEGQVAVIRAEGFSVEWSYADGERVAGPSYTFETQSPTREDKEAILSQVQASGISMTSMASRDGSIQQMAMSRGIPDSGDGPGLDDFEWAETFPAFRNDRTLISPSGEAWVERWVPVESETRLEVFDQEGIWQGSVVLPPRRRLIGFGQGSDGGEVAYLTRTDDYDLKWLERYRVIR